MPSKGGGRALPNPSESKKQKASGNGLVYMVPLTQLDIYF